jgi:ABC-type dipeptide/oligopeptide/nickel transport system permease subunit
MARAFLSVGVLAESVALALGLLIGGIAGFYEWLGRRYLLMRLTDVFSLCRLPSWLWR